MYEYVYVSERVSVCVLAHTHFHTHSLQNYRAAFTSITRTEAEAPNPVRTRRVHQRVYSSRVAEDCETVGRTQACVFRVVNTPANQRRQIRGPVAGVRTGSPRSTLFLDSGSDLFISHGKV